MVARSHDPLARRLAGGDLVAGRWEDVGPLAPLVGAPSWSRWGGPWSATSSRERRPAPTYGPDAAGHRADVRSDAAQLMAAAGVLSIAASVSDRSGSRAAGPPAGPARPRERVPGRVPSDATVLTTAVAGGRRQRRHRAAVGRRERPVRGRAVGRVDVRAQLVSPGRDPLLTAVGGTRDDLGRDHLQVEAHGGFAQGAGTDDARRGRRGRRWVWRCPSPVRSTSSPGGTHAQVAIYASTLIAGHWPQRPAAGPAPTQFAAGFVERQRRTGRRHPGGLGCPADTAQSGSKAGIAIRTG